MTSNEEKAMGSPRTRDARRVLRSLIVTLSVCLMAFAIAAMPALAAATTTTTTTSSTETGYSQKPKPPAEKEKEPAPKEEKKAAPEKETEPAKEVAPAKEEAAAPTPAPAKELPFTGLDLRWIVGAGLLLMAAGGISLRVLRRHERHGTGRQ